MKHTLRIIAVLSAVGTAPAVLAAPEGEYVDPLNSPLTVEDVGKPAFYGAYVGGVVGASCCGEDRVGIGQNLDPAQAAARTLWPKGGTYGLRAGFRAPVTSAGDVVVAVGGELSYDQTGIDDKIRINDYTAATDVKSVLALRSRAGVLNNAQDTWIYAIAGVARVKYDYEVTGNGDVGQIALKHEGVSSSGLIFGAGIEYMLNDNWSVTGEWEYQQFKNKLLKGSYGETTRATPQWHQIRVGVNYEF